MEAQETAEDDIVLLCCLFGLLKMPLGLFCCLCGFIQLPLGLGKIFLCNLTLLLQGCKLFLEGSFGLSFSFKLFPKIPSVDVADLEEHPDCRPAFFKNEFDMELSSVSTLATTCALDIFSSPSGIATAFKASISD